MTDDITLLQTFVAEHSDAAFRALVELRIDFVHATALRQVGGDAHLAREVTQNVFLDLARKARTLAGRPNLTGWFYTSTRFAAAKAQRTRGRRMNYETKAHAMHEILSSASGPAIEWNELRPVIDDALGELGENDRNAILLRFFEGRSHAEVGTAIGLAENSARMRVERALEKLRERLARRGITSTATALGVALAHQPSIAAPVGLAASISGGALAGAAVTAGGTGLGALFSALNFMSSTKLIVGTVGALTVVGIGAWLNGSRHDAIRTDARSATAVSTGTEIATLREENVRLRGELSRHSSSSAGDRSSPAAAGRTAGASTPTVDTLRVLIDLRRRKLANLEFEFFSEGAQLEAAFVELFALSPTEATTLQGTLDATRERMAVLIRENTSVGRAPNGDVTIAVKPFPEAGGNAYDAMLKTFKDTLGVERHNAFLALGAEQAEKMFGRFGTSERAINLSREGAGSELRYRIHDRTRHGPQSNSNYVSDRLMPERFLREIGPLADLLPSDFAPPR
jgi:RNA polymerase sigma factor (sigma-70 family)